MYLILNFFIALVSIYIKNKSGVPYSVLIMIFGIVFGLLASHLGELGSGIDLITYINPELQLCLLIPPIIFEASFTTDFFMFKKEFI